MKRYMSSCSKSNKKNGKEHTTLENLVVYIMDLVPNEMERDQPSLDEYLNQQMLWSKISTKVNPFEYLKKEGKKSTGYCSACAPIPDKNIGVTVKKDMVKLWLMVRKAPRKDQG